MASDLRRRVDLELLFLFSVQRRPVVFAAEAGVLSAAEDSLGEEVLSAGEEMARALLQGVRLLLPGRKAEVLAVSPAIAAALLCGLPLARLEALSCG